MPDPKTETNNEKKDAMLPEEVTKVLEDLKVQLEKSAPPEKKDETPVTKVPSYSESRADLQKRLGFTDEQMNAHEEMILKAQAPVVEATGWQRLEKKTDLGNFKGEIEKELSIYPPERRTPDLMEKIYYYVKGRHADSKPPEKKTEGGNPKERVSSGPGYNGADPNLSGRDAGNQDDEEKLSEVESFVAKKLGVSEKDYARARKVGREAWQLKPADTRESRTTADIELKRLMTR